jgi:hypothetical protein
MIGFILVRIYKLVHVTLAVRGCVVGWSPCSFLSFPSLRLIAYDSWKTPMCKSCRFSWYAFKLIDFSNYVRIAYPLRADQASNKTFESRGRRRPRDSLRSSHPSYVDTFSYFSSHSLSLFHLVLRIHDTLPSPKYFHPAICSSRSFRPSQVFQNIYIPSRYTYIDSESYSEIPAPRTTEKASRTPSSLSLVLSLFMLPTDTHPFRLVSFAIPHRTHSSPYNYW